MVICSRDLTNFLAKEGVVCSSNLETGCKFLWPIVSQDPILRKCLSHKNEGKLPLKQNEVFTIPNIAVSIESFVKFGAKYFTHGDGAAYFLSCYNSDLKQSFPNEYESFQLLTLDNLQSYKVSWYDAIEVKYKDSSVFLPPSPSQVIFTQVPYLKRFN